MKNTDHGISWIFWTLLLPTMFFLIWLEVPETKMWVNIKYKFKPKGFEWTKTTVQEDEKYCREKKSQGYCDKSLLAKASNQSQIGPEVIPAATILATSHTPTTQPTTVTLGLLETVINPESETMRAICNGNINLPSSGGQDSEYDKFILEASCASSINPLLIKAVLSWKSGFDNSPKKPGDACTSKEEAVGLGGLTAKAVKKYKLLLMPDKNNPNQRDLRCETDFAIMATGDYLKQLMGEYAKYESKVELALMDYDHGKGIKLPAKIRGRNEFKWEKIAQDPKLPPEILDNVTKIMKRFEAYKEAALRQKEIRVSPPVVTASKMPATTAIPALATSNPSTRIVTANQWIPDFSRGQETSTAVPVAIPAVITENVISSDDKVLPIEFPFRGEIELAINQLGIVPPYIAGSVMAWEWRLKKDGWSEFEKKFERCAVNFAGAIGPGQQLRKTFKRFGPKGGNICNPADNIYAMVNHLGFLWNYYQSIQEGDRWPIVWIGYHSGEGLIDPLLEMAKGLGLPQNFKTLSNPNFDLPYRIDTGMYEQSGLGPDGREYVPGVLVKLAELQGVEIGDVTQFAGISKPRPSQSIQQAKRLEQTIQPGSILLVPEVYNRIHTISRNPSIELPPSIKKYWSLNGCQTFDNVNSHYPDICLKNEGLTPETIKIFGVGAIIPQITT